MQVGGLRGVRKELVVCDKRFIGAFYPFLTDNIFSMSLTSLLKLINNSSSKKK